MSTGSQRQIAKEMQAVGLAHPLGRANPASSRMFFRQISREVSWGLTLNK